MDDTEVTTLASSKCWFIDVDRQWNAEADPQVLELLFAPGLHLPGQGTSLTR